MFNLQTPDMLISHLMFPPSYNQFAIQDRQSWSWCSTTQFLLSAKKRNTFKMSQSPSGRIMYNPGALTDESFSLDLSFHVQTELEKNSNTLHMCSVCMYVYFVVWTIWKWDTMTLDLKIYQHASPKKDIFQYNHNTDIIAKKLSNNSHSCSWPVSCDLIPSLLH